MKIASLGFEAFLDTDFTPMKGQSSDLSDLITAIRNTDIITPRLTAAIDARLCAVYSRIQETLGCIQDDIFPVFGISAQSGFFDFLKTDLYSLNPGSITQPCLMYYQLCRYTARYLTPLFLNAPDGTIEPDEIKIKKIQDFIRCFFIKTARGYTPAFNGKTAVPAQWRKLTQLLNGTAPLLRNMSKEAAAEFKNRYCMYYRLKQFEYAVKPHIPAARLHDMTAQIETLIDKLRQAEGAPVQSFKNGIEYLLICGVPPQETADMRFFEYEYGCNKKYSASVKEPLKSLINVPAEEGLHDYILRYSEQCIQNSRSGNPLLFDLAQEFRLLELYTTAPQLGAAAHFYHAWYRARLHYAAYVHTQHPEYLENATAAYTEIFPQACLFAGKQLTAFIHESLTVLLEQYPSVKNTGTITAIYGWAEAAGIQVELYREFKAAGFAAPDCNPFSVLIKLWDSGAALVHIAALTHLHISEVQEILRLNMHMLKRQDSGELTRLIQPYEEAELSGGNIFDRFDDF